MKLTTIFFAIMASIVVASPAATPPASTPAVPDDKPAASGNELNTDAASADCKQCDAFFRKCMGTTWCWFDPYACSKTCDLDTCRQSNHGCTPCGYTDKC